MTSTTTWHDLTTYTALTEMDATASGLSTQQATDRLEQYGRNELAAAESDPWWKVLGRQFASPMIYFLIACVVITAIEREWVDAAAITVILLINASVGFWQEKKAEADVKALASLATPVANVVRDGNLRGMAAAEIVPGDIVRLESGDRVPADLRLLDVNGLRVDESMLTGEALPAEKSVDPLDAATLVADRSNVAYSGTMVVGGRATGLVTATGADTELGNINSLVQGARGKTPLQMLTHRLERHIGIGIAVAAALVMVAGLAMGTSLSEMFRTAVALVVSAMPEALPIVMTVALGVGVSRMARHKVAVRRLPSVETLGSTTVVGSDKTGTLTQNLMTVERVWTADATLDLTADADAPTIDAVTTELLRAGGLTNEARYDDGELVGDAVDVAMARVAIELGALTDAELASRPLADMPYESEAGYSQTVYEREGRRVLYVKGAPERIVGFATSMRTASGDVDLDASAVDAANQQMAAEGLRVIATAMRVVGDHEDLPADLPDPSGLTLLGLEGMMDPPREGVLEAIEQCKAAGIRVIMITGDHPITAQAIGARLGLETSGEPITGAQIADLDDDELRARLAQTDIAARMAPADKLRIVELLMDDDETVAVTGDGVNDAPALKSASVGVAMGLDGTDVAREAADVVLTDDNFVSIVEGVEQGRVTFSTIRKATMFLLSSAVATMLAVALNVFFPQPLIFIPVMMLWMNIVTNGLEDVALAFEPGEGDELEQQPRSLTEGVLDKVMWVRVVVTGLWMGLITLFVYNHALGELGYDLEHARTLALTTMVMFNFFQVMNARTERRSLFTINPLRNKFLVFGSIATLLLHWGAMSWSVSAGILGMTALSAMDWLVCLGLGATIVVVVEIDKAIRRRQAR